MVKVSILYPNRPNRRFDMAYYFEKHMRESIERLSVGKGFRGVSVERGLNAGPPDTAPAYLAMCHYVFDTAADFMAIFGEHASYLQTDIANYTDIEPVIQFSEVMISRGSA
jgi:uncharacterized protein (TIGR02118 family)